MMAIPTPHTAPVVPRMLVAAMMLIMLISLAWVGIYRLSSVQDKFASSLVLRERALRFEDLPNGAIQITDATTNQIVQTYTDEGGFLRGALRGLARERRRAGFGPQQPFLLTIYANGRFMLADPITRQRIGLEAFGSHNAAVFARLLETTQISAKGMP
jgi:putative photosynthetic complex assembly protein